MDPAGFAAALVEKIATTDVRLIHEKLTPNTARHFMTTMLERAGCPRTVISELRGDAPQGIIGIYREVSDEELQREYERCIPKFFT